MAPSLALAYALVDGRVGLTPQRVCGLAGRSQGVQHVNEGSWPAFVCRFLFTATEPGWSGFLMAIGLPRFLTEQNPLQFLSL